MEQARGPCPHLTDRVFNQPHSHRTPDLALAAHVVHALLRQRLAGQQDQGILRRSRLKVVLRFIKPMKDGAGREGSRSLHRA